MPEPAAVYARSRALLADAAMLGRERANACLVEALTARSAPGMTADIRHERDRIARRAEALWDRQNDDGPPPEADWAALGEILVDTAHLEAACLEAGMWLPHTRKRRAWKYEEDI